MNSFIDIENLYGDNDFHTYLLFLSRQKHLDLYDFKRNVFVELLEKIPRTFQDCKRIANTVAMRNYRDEMRQPSEYPFFDDSNEHIENAESVLWEDNHFI